MLKINVDNAYSLYADGNWLGKGADWKTTDDYNIPIDTQMLEYLCILGDMERIGVCWRLQLLLGKCLMSSM